MFCLYPAGAGSATWWPVFPTTTAVQKIANMDVKQKLANVGMWDNRKGVTITGYTALACFSALCTSVAMAVIHFYKKWKGIRDDGYVQVVKRGDL